MQDFTHILTGWQNYISLARGLAENPVNWGGLCVGLRIFLIFAVLFIKKKYQSLKQVANP